MIIIIISNNNNTNNHNNDIHNIVIMICFNHNNNTDNNDLRVAPLFSNELTEGEPESDGDKDSAERPGKILEQREPAGVQDNAL